MKATGTYVKCSTAGEAFQAFVPAPLPPQPPLALNEGDQDLMEHTIALHPDGKAGVIYRPEVIPEYAGCQEKR